MTQRNATQHKDKLITVTHNEMYESLSHHIYLKKKKQSIHGMTTFT